MKKIILIIAAFVFATHCFAQQMTLQEKEAMCEKVKDACRHAWSGYKQYAWGDDALKPISKKGHNWYGTSLLMTPVDAFDTFYLLGLDDEASEAKELVFSKLSFDVDIDVQVFEITIRLLGGLQSSYELDGDKKFLELAHELGKRLLPAFDTKTGMPWRYINLETGAVKGVVSNPAEIGTLFLEFGKLTQLTGDSAYYKAGKKAIMEVFARRSKIGLVGTEINVRCGKWKKKSTHISGLIDSYYEYLYKGWKLFGDEDFKEAWEISNAAVLNYLLKETPHGSFFTHARMKSGKETHSHYGALDAFYAGLLAYAGDIETARKVQEANYYMWTKCGIEPEVFDFRTDSVLHAGYPLRPENIESCFYLYRLTHDHQYLRMGEDMTNDILTQCKTEAGYAAMSNVLTGKLSDSMESFFFAETLKYAYLLFADKSALDLEKWVFTTEAHPFRIR